MNWILESTTTAGGEALRWELSDGPHRIGRASQSEIILSDPSVSKAHAEIVIETARVEIRDLGSRNGTWVNDRRVVEPTPIAAGDRIRVGGVELKLRDAGSSSSTRSLGATLSEPGQIHATTSLGHDAVMREIENARRPDHRLLRALTEAGKVLISLQPIEDVFDTVLDLAAGVIPARRILLLLSEKDGDEPVVRAARPRGSADRERIMLSRTLVDAVLRKGESLLVIDAMRDPGLRMHESIVMQNVRSAMVAPLFDNERILGLIYADTSDPTVQYDDDQLRVFTMLANLIAIKITNTHLLEAQRAKERMEQEMATASMIQQNLLPAELPRIEGYDMHARQIPCFEVGGDLYDAARTPDEMILFAVGDVSGKGLGAALLMSHVMASIRVLSEGALSLPALVEKVHREVLRSSDSRNYATLFIARLDPRAHRLDYVNAGHNPPILLCGADPPRMLDSTSMPVGLMDGAVFEAASCEIPPGALLTVFSDGVTEALRGDEFYGEDRLIEGLRRRLGQPTDEIASGVMDDLRAFVGDEPASDDITLLLVRREGS